MPPTESSSVQPPAPRLHELLRATREKGGSDLHLAAGMEPRMRIHGALEPVGARPNLAADELSALLREVRLGREIVITDRGEPVARLTPPARGSARPFPDLGAFRRRIPAESPPLSPAIAEERDERG